MQTHPVSLPWPGADAACQGIDFAGQSHHVAGMKIKDADILIIPGYKNSGPDHWQSRWLAKMSTAKRVEQAEWSKPVREDWVATLRDAISACEKPVILVGHSLGVATAVQATHDAGEFEDTKKVAGGFFVAPPEVTNPAIKPKHLMTFGPYPSGPLPYPSVVISSNSDPFGALETIREAAYDWGSLFVDAGDAGHIDAASGHGPWPEGLLTLARFMAKL